MFGIRNKKTREILAFFMHIPKTSGSHIIQQIQDSSDDYDIINIRMMYDEDNGELRKSIGGHADPRHEHFPIENHAHLTLDQAFCLYPKLKEYINTHNIDVFTIIRDPYERFVSQVRFIPSLMISDFDKRGKNKNLLERLDSHWFHFYYTNLIFEPQWKWCYENSNDENPYTRIIRLDEVKDTIYEVTKGFEVDFSQNTWSNEEVNSEIGEVPFSIPKFTLDEGTKNFVKWLYKDDFRLLFAGIAQ